MTILTILSLLGGGLTGSLAASGNFGRAEADRIRLVAGSLLATGLLLLGAGLHTALAGRL